MLAVVALTASLGFWQLDRAAQKRALAEQARAAQSAEPVVVQQHEMSADAVRDRRLIAVGEWVSDKAVFLDNRTHAGRAGFHVFMPLRLVGEGPPRHLLVLRGWMPADPADRERLPALEAASGEQRVSGRAVLALEAAMQLAEAAPPAERGRLWQAVNLADYASWSGLSLQPFLLREEPGGQHGYVREWPQPADDVATHHGYALQWFLIGAAAVGLWAWATWGRPERVA